MTSAGIEMAGTGGTGKPVPARRALPAWRLYDVAVQGFGTAPVPERSRGRALAAAWQSDAFSHLTFKGFLKVATATLRTETPMPDGYDYVRASYGLDVGIGSEVTLEAEGQWHHGLEGVVAYPGSSSTSYVHVLVEGHDRPLIVHPSEVVPKRDRARVDGGTGLP